MDTEMRSADGTEWELHSWNGSGRVIGYGGLLDATISVHSYGVMRCEGCLTGGYADYDWEFTSVATNGFIAVGVGESGHVAIHDAVTPTEHLTNVSADFTGVAWDGRSEFLASCSDGIVRSSDDGVTWNDVGNTRSGRLRAIAVHKSRVVVLGDDGQIVQSNDLGKTWATVPDYAGLHDVAWSGNAFVAVGDNGTALLSALSWGWRRVRTNVTDTLWSVDGGPLTVAVGNSGTILTSEDDLIWTRHEPARPLDFSDVIWTGDVFVAVADHVGLQVPIYLSDDGVDWTPANSLEEVGSIWGIEDVAWSGTRAIGSATAFGSFGGDIPQHAKVYASDDLQNWRVVHVTYDSYYGNNVFVLNGEFIVLCSDEVLRSPDGESWTSSPWSAYWQLLSFSGVTVRDDTVYGIEWDGRISESNDLLAWRSAGNLALPGGKAEINWTGNGFLASGYGTGEGRVWWSTDGYEWTAVDPGTRNRLWGVAASPDRWIVVGDGGTIFTRDARSSSR